MENKLNILDRLLVISEKYKLVTVFKSLFILLLIVGTFAFIKNPTYVFEKYNEWNNKQHQEQIERRITNNAETQLILEKLMYRTDADRVMLLEFHNSGKNNSGLPFAKITCTYECLNDSIYPIANEYQNIQLSLFPFTNLLLKQKYYFGDTEKLLEVDKHLYYKFKSNNINHFACCVIEGIDDALGALLVGYEDISEIHNCRDINNLIINESLRLSLLLEINKFNK